MINFFKNNFKNNFIIFLLLICFTSKAFSQKSIIIFKTDYTNNYMNYAVYDLLIKNIFLYSNLKIINNENNFNYEKIKSQIKKLTTQNKANISVSYKIQNFKNGILLNYIIFDNEKPNEWIEKSVYSKEENLFMSINKLLKDIYDNSNNRAIYITEENYTSLLGYYSQKFNQKNNFISSDIYKLFYDFYKENIYFNIDYLEFLMNRIDKTNSDIINELVENMPNYFNHNKNKNHYYLYSLGCMHYGKYKVEAISSDIESSIENYNNALKLNSNYKYYYRLANAYMLKNDYDNAKKYFEEAIKLDESNIDIMKELLSLLKRDIDKNGNEVIYYLKKIIEINKNDREALTDILKLYERIGDYESFSNYNKILEDLNK